VLGIFAVARMPATVSWPVAGNIWRDARGWVEIFPVIGLVGIIVIPLLAVIFAAVPLMQGQGTDWDGKRAAKAGLATGSIAGLYWAMILFMIISLICPFGLSLA